MCFQSTPVRAVDTDDDLPAKKKSKVRKTLHMLTHKVLVATIDALEHL